MKRQNILELLTDRPIVHPTRIDAVEWRGRQLTIAVRGYRWWASPYEDRQIEGEISLVFNGLGKGLLLTDELEPDDDEALDGFEVFPVSDVPWAQACDWSIYCSGPIDEPVSLFTKVQDYLRRCDAIVGPEHFLNQATNLASFVTMTKAGGFLVGRGPPCIRDLVCAELERQAVPHNVVPTPEDSEPEFLVRLGNSAFLCQEALAELPD